MTVFLVRLLSFTGNITKSVSPSIALLLLLPVSLPSFSQAIHSRIISNRTLPNPYYPQMLPGQLRLNYYYDRSGRWVKFSDWIPYQQRKFVPRHLEDFYHLYGLPYAYKTSDVKQNIYWLVQALTHKFRHPQYALTKIKNKQQYHKYRLLMFMHINQLIARMFLRLGSLYDKRFLSSHDLDFADDLEISFLIARSYYRQALPFWKQSLSYAKQASQYRFDLDFPAIENERFQIMQGKLNMDRSIQRHLYKVEAKLAATKAFLDKEGRPRPVKQAIQKDIEEMYNEKDFNPSPLREPVEKQAF